MCLWPLLRFTAVDGHVIIMIVSSVMLAKGFVCGSFLSKPATHAIKFDPQVKFVFVTTEYNSGFSFITL